jgi:recombination protein RecA
MARSSRSANGVEKEEKIVVDNKNGTDREREKAIESAMSQIERAHGKGAIMKMGDASVRMAVEVVPTGSISLDLALGVGGVPRGRIIEIYGPESSGKTTLAYHIIAEAQKLGGVGAYIDVEHAVDSAYAANCGVDLDNLYISQPDTGEQALEITETLVRSGAIDVIVIDSVSALTPRAEIEGEMGDSHVGLQARLMSQALRKLTAAVSKSRTVLIFINQLRMKIGVMFGNPETTSGGQALKFYASVRLDIRKVEALKSGLDEVGNHVRVKVIKNKVAPPFRKAEFDIMFGSGISKEGDLIDVGVQMNILRKSGAFFYLNDLRLGQGKENAREFLKANPDISEEIEGLIRSQNSFAKGLPVGDGLAISAIAPEPDEEGDEADLEF